MEEKSMETEPETCYLHQNQRQEQQQSPPQSSYPAVGSSGSDEKMSSSNSVVGVDVDDDDRVDDDRVLLIRQSESHTVSNNNNNKFSEHELRLGRNGVVDHHGGRAFGGGRSVDDTGIGMSSTAGSLRSGGNNEHRHVHRPSRACPSPISSIVGSALNQINLKRSSSAPMINQLGVNGGGSGGGGGGNSGGSGVPETPGVSPSSTPTSGLVHSSTGKQESIADVDAASAYASSFLSSLGGARPRRFSASFSPAGSPGPAPNRVSQLRQENTQDWETMSEKDFHGTVNIAQSWEDLSLDSMSMEVGTRRPSISDQLWLSMPPSSAPSSPAASPRVLSRFSPSLSSPSPTRKSFTTRRSLSPIAVRPSVLSIGQQQGVKRKCDWDSNGSSSNQMDCSPQPAKRHGGVGGLLSSFTPSGGSPVSQFSSPGSGTGGGVGYPFNYSNTSVHQQYFPGIANPAHNSSSSPYNPNNSSTSSNSLMSMITNHIEDSPFSNETESSVSSIGGCDSPFFRPVDSPLASVTTSPEDSPRPSYPKI